MTASVVRNCGHCIYSIGLKCFLCCLSLFHLLFYLLQSNTRYFVDHLERFTYHVYIYIYSVLFFLHNCPLLIPLHNTAVLIKICRFLINVVKFTQALTKLDLLALRKGSIEERTPSECQIFYFFRCVLSSMLPLRSVGRSNFVMVCVNLTTLIKKRHILMRTAVLCNGINSGQL